MRRPRQPPQAQSAGDNALQLQVGRDFVQGVTVDQAREIALDVYRKNALDLSGTATDLAVARSEKLVDSFLKGLVERAPAGLRSAADPDMQWVLYAAQIDYARSGDADLETVLVDLLIDRASHTERDLQTIVLNEALSAVPKLTKAQCHAIAVHAVFQLSQRLERPPSLDAFYEDHVRGDILPLADELPLMPDSYRHIEYVGAGSVGPTGPPFVAAFAAAHEGWFTHGFSESDIPDVLKQPHVMQEGFIIPSLRDPTRLQLGTMRTADVEGLCAQAGWDDLLEPMLQLYATGAMALGEIEGELWSRVPELIALKKIWEESALNRLTLTTVGTAIGHATWRSTTGRDVPLSFLISPH